ncbi:cold shock protein 1-like isoform X2 [Hibiscus syriacus]|uniref:cold shock protein 1-like isoform X2 n=1 Tax=Hibiscus syriacus TaxID=106335 RepID=UPI001922E674|nr:cold shock protein 1-like isoform X2 [Hibiscus syriacus]
MVEGEATVKRKRRRRRYRKRMYNNESQYQAHQSVPVDSGKSAIYTGKDEAVRTVAVLKWDFNEFVDTDVMENKMIETVQAVTCRTEGNADEASSMEVTDICSSSSVDEGLISNICSGTSTGDMVSAVGTIRVDGVMVRSELKSVLAEETVDAGMKEMHAEKDKCVEIVKSSAKNTVLRSHLKRRYFDLPNGNWARCLDYGEYHPAAANCLLQRRGKVCFLSRNNQHIGKHCSQGQYCFVCRGTFRQAHDCPKKQEENHIICLRCGDSGHDMFSCISDYSADDLKKIRCYVCEDFGHLSCVKLPYTSPTEASCYNCGQSGHFGSDCSKCPKVVRGSKSPALCYRCREKGHFARTCTLPRKHARKVRAEVRSPGSSSAPPKLEPQSDANNCEGETQALIINIIQ